MIPLGPCLTRSGAPAVVIANDVADPLQPVAARVRISPTEERVYSYTAEGRFDPYDLRRPHSYDLVLETGDAGRAA